MGAMMLWELVKRLEREGNLSLPVYGGFGAAGSYRGGYAELAFAPMAATTVGAMLASAKNAGGRTYEGYKGGEFFMDDWSPCHVAGYGQCNGDADAITPEWLETLLAVAHGLHQGKGVVRATKE